MTKPNDENDQKNKTPPLTFRKRVVLLGQLAREKKMFYVAVFLCQDCQLQVGGEQGVEASPESCYC